LSFIELDPRKRQFDLTLLYQPFASSNQQSAISNQQSFASMIAVFVSFHRTCSCPSGHDIHVIFDIFNIKQNQAPAARTTKASFNLIRFLIAITENCPVGLSIAAYLNPLPFPLLPSPHGFGFWNDREDAVHGTEEQRTERQYG
jgi:hypothetical protein